MIFFTNNETETIELGKKIGALLAPGDVLALSGTLGAGKTTFTKGIAQALNISEEITSPTFCLISEYDGRLPLYHFDVYRLSGSDDFVNLGAEEMIYGNGVCIIEWSEKIKDELPENTIFISINVNKNSNDKNQCENQDANQDKNQDEKSSGEQNVNERKDSEQNGCKQNGSGRKIIIENADERFDNL